MKKSFIKVAAAALALTASVFAFTGCANNVDDSSETTVEGNLLTASVDLGNWANNVELDATTLSDAAEGSVLTVKTTASTLVSGATYYQLQFKYRATNWPALGMEGTLTGGTLDTSWNGIALSSDTATVTYTLTSDDVEKIKEYGLAIGGYGVTVTAVTLTAAAE